MYGACPAYFIFIFFITTTTIRENSGFRREVHGNCVLLGYYTASSGKSFPTFRDNLSVPSSRTKTGQNFEDGTERLFRSRLEAGGTEGRPETSVRNYHCSISNSPEERGSHNYLLRPDFLHTQNERGI